MARIIFLIAFCIMLAAANVYAATHAVRPSTATDAVNGCAIIVMVALGDAQQLKGQQEHLIRSAHVRGDTYYLSTANYGTPSVTTFRTAVSGTAFIGVQTPIGMQCGFRWSNTQLS